jgi:hypothetical protein
MCEPSVLDTSMAWATEREVKKKKSRRRANVDARMACV